MKKLLESNFFLIVLLVLVFCYLMSFISTDVVMNDKVYQKYLDEKYETKYNEYKNLDVDLAEFEDELKQFEQSAEESSYDWGAFYIDSLFVLAPLFLVVLSFSCTFLVLILFHKKLHSIRFLYLLKASLLSYILFYTTEIVSSIYFLVFKDSYELKEIHNFESFFYFSKFFNEEQTPDWLWNIVSETGIVYILFPLLVALLLKTVYQKFPKRLLIGYAYMTYLIVLVLYNTVFWYLFDLI